MTKPPIPHPVRIPTGKSFSPTPAHTALMVALRGALAAHPEVQPMEMLAVTSQLVGNLVALQDQTKFTPAAVMEVVGWNIELGNEAAIAGLRDAQPAGHG